MSEHEQQNYDQPDRAYEIGENIIDAVRGAIGTGARGDLIALFNDLHPADIADILEQVNSTERMEILTLWGDEIEGEVLAEMEESLSADVMEALPDSVVGEAMRDLDTDDVVDLVEDMDEPQQERVLGALDTSDRLAVQQSLAYDDETAGRLMQRELVMAPTHWTVGDVLDAVRSDDDLPDRFYDIVIVDPKMEPVGKVALHTLLSNPRGAKLPDLMDEEFRVIPASQSQEDVAYAFNQYNMVSAPVVDDQNRLVGVITMDDAMEVLEDEADEDIKLLAGVGDEALTDSMWETTRLRFPWLAVNLVTCILASMVISQFAATIEAIVALAVLMPIVASMGGNAGTQTLTVTVRALATKDLTRANAWRIIRREVIVGFFNGIIFAVIIGIVGVIWFGTPMLGIVLALAMVVNMVVAGLAGISIPIVLDKLGVDPALASSAFVTTVTDVVGFFVFLGLAATLLIS